MDRLGMLRKMVETKADDPFPHYGLAMELAKLGHDDEARSTFAGLMERFPAYVPAYLMAGNHLARTGDPAGAALVYDRGVEVATAAGDDHAVGELQAARAELP